jgi:CxxC motif-containing protein (DUF1111 family)
MSKTSDTIVTHEISHAVPPWRPSRAWLCALAGLIGLTAAGLAGLILAVGFWLCGAPTVAGFGTPEPVPGSGGARGHASGDPAAIRGVATALRGPVPDPERPPSRPVDSRAPRPPRDNGLPQAAGPTEVPRSVADPAGRRPGASMPPDARPGPDRPAGDGRSLGRELFARRWLPDDPRCHGGDGLGPVYNATSCVDCHNQGGPGGGGPVDRNVELATGIGYMVFPGNTSVIVDRMGNGWRGGFDQEADPADMVKVHPGFRDARSTVLQRFGVDPDYSRWRSTFLSRCRMTPHVPTRSISGPGRRPRTVTAPSRDGKPASRPIPPVRSRQALDRALMATVRDVGGGLGMNRVAFVLTARNTPPLFGAGLIDGLSDSELEQSEQNQSGETQGRVLRLKDGRLGRFGWKAQVASLDDFVLTACANELGLEAPGRHQGVSPLAPEAQARGLDLTAEECAALVEYVRSLPSPVSLDPSDAQTAAAVARGRRLFHSIGCASCHTADLGSIRGIYSDLLLHDMGLELSDSGAYYSDESESLGAATRSEWRTPPLWGFRDTAPYLHNGQARNLEEAVALHHGQGAASASRFRQISDRERSRVETFLNSLVAPSAAAATHRAGEAAHHPANQPGADPAPPPGHGAANRGSMLGES